MDEVRVKVIVDDSDVERFVNGVTASGQQAQATMDEIGTSSTRTARAVQQSFRNQERAIIDSTRAADDYQRSIKDNEQQIQRLNRAMDNEKLLLLDLQKRYKRLGDASTKEAKAMKQQIDLLNKSLRQSTEETKILAQQNVVANHSLQALAEGGDRAAGKIKLSSFEARNLGFQLQDLAVQIGSGQGIFRPLIQQGPQIVSALGGSGRAMQFFRQQAGGALKSVLSLRGGAKLLLGGLAGLIAVPIIAFFTKSEKAADFLGNKIAYLQGVFGELTNRAVKVGEALFEWITFSGSFSAVTDAFADSVTGLGDALNEAGQNAQQLRRDLKELEQSQTAYAQGEERIRTVIQERRRIVDDETKSIRQRIQAETAARNLERVQQKAFLANAKEELRIAREKNAGKEELIDLNNAVIVAQRDLANAEFDSEQRLKDLRQEAVDQYRERQQALKDLQQQSQSVLQQLRRLSEDDVSGIDKIRRDTISAVDEVKRLEMVLRELYAQQGQVFDLEENFTAALQAVQAKGIESIRDFNRQRNIEEARAAQERLDREIQSEFNRISALEELALLRADNQRFATLSEVEAEQAAARQKLQIQIEYTRQRLALIADQNGVEAQLYRENIESLQQSIEALGTTNLTPVQQLGEKIRSALGLNEESFGQVAGLFQQFGSTIFDTLGSITEAQIIEQDRLIASLQERTQETENALREQLKLQEQGFANDVGLLEQKLAAENAAIEKAEAAKLALEKRQARQRLQIEAAQQASSYITTVLNLLATESGRGIVGLIAVAAGGLALIGSIVAKARANAASFEAPQFRHGTDYVEGPGTGTSDSIPAYLSKGERVVTYEGNQALGGKSVSEQELIHYFQLGKQVAKAPTFAGVDDKTRAAIKHGHQLSQLEQERVLAMQKKAFKEAADRSADKMIAYWQTRPVVIPTKEGRVVKYKEGNAEITKIVKRR